MTKSKLVSVNANKATTHEGTPGNAVEVKRRLSTKSPFATLHFLRGHFTLLSLLLMMAVGMDTKNSQLQIPGKL